MLGEKILALIILANILMWIMLPWNINSIDNKLFKIHEVLDKIEKKMK